MQLIHMKFDISQFNSNDSGFCTVFTYYVNSRLIRLKEYQRYAIAKPYQKRPVMNNILKYCCTLFVLESFFYSEINWDLIVIEIAMNSQMADVYCHLNSIYRGHSQENIEFKVQRYIGLHRYQKFTHIATHFFAEYPPIIFLQLSMFCNIPYFI